ncbi:hypothetical protein QTP88_023693 [Uroleucon formosanum]
MSSDEEDALCALNLLNILNTKQKRVRNYWVHPFWRENCRRRGAFSVFKDLEDNNRFQSFYRMEKKTFDILVDCCTKFIGGEMGIDVEEDDKGDGVVE